jgi:hypothetical protein
VIDGVRITERTVIRDGARIELGNVVLRFRDPAERHLRGAATAVAGSPSVRPLPPPVPPTVEQAPSRWPVVIATSIAGLALAGLVWVLAT